MKDVRKELLRTQKELKEARRVIQKKRYIIESLEQQLSALRINDPLTGIFNKKQLIHKYKEALSFHKRFGVRVTLGLFNIDGLKEMNKDFGDDFGDTILINFGEISKRLIRDDLDSVFRIGGDEFILLMIDCDYKDANQVCNRIKNQFATITEGYSLSYSVVEIHKPQELTLNDYLKTAHYHLEQKELVN